MRDTIAIVGCGFVGTAVKEGMKHAFEIETYDKFCPEKSTCSSLEELVEKTDVIFVCLPTPMKEDGSCDTSIVEKCIGDIVSTRTVESIRQSHFNEYYDGDKPDEPFSICIKSTVPPGTTKKIQDIYDAMIDYGSFVNIIQNPEFLTEANANQDFKDQDRIILGGCPQGTSTMREIYQQAFPLTHIVECSSDMSEMVKYAANNFLTVKVAFANELFEIATKLGLDYDELVEIVTMDDRIGKWGWQVPGRMVANGLKPEDVVMRPGVAVEGDNVYLPMMGGSCFPKDLNGMIAWCSENKVESEVLSAVWKKTLRLRPEKDWENLEGRAVVKKEE